MVERRDRVVVMEIFDPTAALAKARASRFDRAAEQERERIALAEQRRLDRLAEKEQAAIRAAMSGVYFMLCNKVFVKIGASEDVGRRVAGLQCDSPYPCRLLYVWHVSLTQEQALHARFKRSHHRGEWFRYTKEIRVFIAQCKAVDRNPVRRRYFTKAHRQQS
jgi:hypothetical protein